MRRNPLVFPLPNSADKARFLLEFIRLGVIFVDAFEYDDRYEVYVKSPERIHFNDENGNPYNSHDVLIQFKRRFQAMENKKPMVLKRAPYKNEFDDWYDGDRESAFDEFKTWLMFSFTEDELMI